MIIKKYANRRLYDTTESRYITLEELTLKIRHGADVVVQDAQNGADLTQATLTQIILESRGGAKLLPVPLLVQLIRMGDEALAEFFGRYMSWALEMYLRAKSQAQAISSYVPLATVPFSATNALARMVMGNNPWNRGGDMNAQPPMQPEAPPPMDMPAPPPVAPSSSTNMADDMAMLRREIEALKASVTKGKKKKHAARAK